MFRVTASKQLVAGLVFSLLLATFVQASHDLDHIRHDYSVYCVQVGAFEPMAVSVPVTCDGSVTIATLIPPPATCSRPDQPLTASQPRAPPPATV